MNKLLSNEATCKLYLKLILFVDCHIVILQKLNALEDVRAIKNAITQIAAGGVSGINSAIAEDLIPNPLNTMNEMKEIIEKMKDETYKKKLVSLRL